MRKEKMGGTEARMCKETERYNMLLCAFSGTGEHSVRAGFRVCVSGKTRSCKWGGGYGQEGQKEKTTAAGELNQSL